MLSSRFSRTQMEPLTIDQVKAYAPSAFAVEKHESRSPRYTYIPTSTVLEAMMKEGFQPFRAHQSWTRVEGKGDYTKHLIRFRREGVSLTTVGDSVPEVVLVNSHDGSSAYKLFAGVFRLVCTNGLIVSDGTIGSLSVPHKGNIVDKVIEGSFQIVDQSRNALNEIGQWSSLQLTQGEQIAFAEAAHTLRFADSDGQVDTPITASQLLTSRRSGDNGNDLWKTFNRVQENALRGGLSNYKQDASTRRLRRTTTREVKGIDQDVRLNRALWQLGQRMAELKGSTQAA